MKFRNSVLLVLVWIVSAAPAVAAIYQSTDAQGNAVFSDEPSGGATALELPPLPTYSAPKYRPARPSANGSDQTTKKGYSELSIQQPQQDATIRDNTGAVPVAVAIEPKLNGAAGHRLQFLLDGQPVGEPGTQTTTTLPNVNRGAHQIQAVVTDGSGRELKRSDSITFYLHRQSVNFPTGPARPTPLPGR